MKESASRDGRVCNSGSFLHSGSAGNACPPRHRLSTPFCDEYPCRVSPLSSPPFLPIHLLFSWRSRPPSSFVADDAAQCRIAEVRGVRFLSPFPPPAVLTLSFLLSLLSYGSASREKDLITCGTRDLSLRQVARGERHEIARARSRSSTLIGVYAVPDLLLCFFPSSPRAPLCEPRFGFSGKAGRRGRYLSSFVPSLS